MGELTVLRAGPLMTVQDLGRVGHRHEGVSLGGALDRQAARIANWLVGNEESAALLEISLGRARFRFSDERTIAWCGGEFQIRVGGENFPPGHACSVHAGEEVEIAPGGRGCRVWMTISAGIDVPPVLGSRATDLRARFGGWHGRALEEGDTLPLGQRAFTGEMPRVSAWSAPQEWSQTASPYPMLRLLRGAEWAEFSEASRNLFFSRPFVVSPKCDRMGARLEGEPLQRRRPNERVSEPVAPGTIQVPDDGQPIILLGDCQTIGGYPKIGHVISVDLPRAAQLRPNDSVRFVEVTAREAALLHAQREEELQRFRIGLKLRAR